MRLFFSAMTLGFCLLSPFLSLASENKTATLDVVTSATMKVQEVAIIARNFEYLPNIIVLKKGKPVKIYLTSIDRQHDLLIEGMKIRKEVEKGKITVLNFVPEKTGVFHFHCDSYCGRGHGGMHGQIIVTEK